MNTLDLSLPSGERLASVVLHAGAAHSAGRR